MQGEEEWLEGSDTHNELIGMPAQMRRFCGWFHILEQELRIQPGHLGYVQQRMYEDAWLRRNFPAKAVGCWRIWWGVFKKQFDVQRKAKKNLAVLKFAFGMFAWFCVCFCFWRLRGTQRPMTSFKRRTPKQVLKCASGNSSGRAAPTWNPALRKACLQ